MFVVPCGPLWTAHAVGAMDLSSSSDSEEARDSVAIAWEDLGRQHAHLLKCSPAPVFLFGPLQRETKQRQLTQRTRRLALSSQDAVRPTDKSSQKDESQDRSKAQKTQVIELLGKIKGLADVQGRKDVPMIDAVVADSLKDTTANLFSYCFLVKEGLVKNIKDGDNNVMTQAIEQDTSQLSQAISDADSSALSSGSKASIIKLNLENLRKWQSMATPSTAQATALGPALRCREAEYACLIATPVHERLKLPGQDKGGLLTAVMIQLVEGVADLLFGSGTMPQKSC
eukprot:gene6173-1104_t